MNKFQLGDRNNNMKDYMARTEEEADEYATEELIEHIADASAIREFSRRLMKWQTGSWDFPIAKFSPELVESRMGRLPYGASTGTVKRAIALQLYKEIYIHHTWK
jgi:hypothetical protein